MSFVQSDWNIMNYYAEEGLDRYIRNTFFNDWSKPPGIMVEVGAGETRSYSVSRHFRENGWRCICIEPNPNFVEAHKKEGNEIYQYACSFAPTGSATFKIVQGMSFSALTPRYCKDSGQSITVEVRTLNSILEELKIEHVDFVSIDTEGWEKEVMMGFDVDKYQPKVIILEDYYRKKTYNEYMLTRGYKHHYSIPPNDIYVKTEILS